jgi:endogenous inhibitor of DNA gyrase (YacG/DUF329 family)
MNICFKKEILFIFCLFFILNQNAFGIISPICQKNDVWDEYNISFIFPTDCKEIDRDKPTKTIDHLKWAVHKDINYPFEMIIQKVAKMEPDQNLISEFVSRIEAYNCYYDDDLKNYTINNDGYVLEGKRANGTEVTTGHKIYLVLQFQINIPILRHPYQQQSLLPFYPFCTSI